MSLSNSRLAYNDCFELLDRALDEARGIRIELASADAATYLRMRIHHARQIDRRENKATYPDLDHPLHDRSPYDILVCRIEPDAGRAWLHLDKQKVEIGRIEPIPAEAQIEYHQVKMIEGPKALPPIDLPIVAPIPGIRRR